MRDGARLLPGRIASPRRGNSRYPKLLGRLLGGPQDPRRDLEGTTARTGRTNPTAVRSSPSRGACRRRASRWTGEEGLQPARIPMQPYSGTADLLADLQTMAASLRDHHGASLVDFRLGPLIRAVEVFGFHLADGRPAPEFRPPRGSPRRTDGHRRRRARLRGPCQRRTRWRCCCACSAKRGRCVCPSPPIRTRRRASSTSSSRPGGCAGAFGPEDDPATTSSVTPRPSATFSKWLLLQKEFGLMNGPLGGAGTATTADLIVSPLFETIADLRHAEPIMREFLRAARHRGADRAVRRPAGHHAGLFGQQTRDGGFFTSSWELYRSSTALVALFRREAQDHPAAVSTGAAARSGAAVARATRRSWRSRPAP